MFSKSEVFSCAFFLAAARNRVGFAIHAPRVLLPPNSWHVIGRSLPCPTCLAPRFPF